MRTQHFEGCRSCLPPHLFVAHPLRLPDAHIIWSAERNRPVRRVIQPLGGLTAARSRAGSSTTHIGACSTIRMLAQGRTRPGSPSYSHLRFATPRRQFSGVPPPMPGQLTGVIRTHSLPICFDCCMRVLHLNILVTHESPRCKIGPVELGRAPEVLDSLLVFCTQ